MPVITDPSCPHCKQKMITDWGDPFYCNNDQCPEKIEMKQTSDELAECPEPLNLDTPEYAEGEREDYIAAGGEWYVLPHEERKKDVRDTVCWKCFELTGKKVLIIRREDNDTGTYGHSCDVCRYNLEENPKWGKGGPMDLAVHRGKRRHE